MVLQKIIKKKEECTKSRKVCSCCCCCCCCLNMSPPPHTHTHTHLIYCAHIIACLPGPAQPPGPAIPARGRYGPGEAAGPRGERGIVLAAA